MTAAVPTPSPFGVPIFRNVWIANLGSRFGGLIQSVGASWMMLSLASSPVMVTLVQASTTLPVLLFALVAGALADTFDRRRMMLAAQYFMLAVSIALTACAYLGVLTPWLLLSFTFLIGCGGALNGPAWQASVGEMVPREALPSAIALNSMGFNVARSAGPAVGGVIVAAAGAAVAFAINMVSYVGLIVVLSRWRSPETKAGLPRERLGAAMLAGIRYAAMSPAIVAVLLRATIFGLGASAIPSLTPLIARDLVAGGPLSYGLLLGAFGVGAVIGAFFSTALRSRLSSEALVQRALLALAASAVIAAISSQLLLTMAALVVGGAGWVLALSTFNVTVQLATPRWVVARALALYQMAAFGGMAAGSWLWGSITENDGLTVALIASAAVVAGCAALGLWFGLPQSETVDLSPLDRWREPSLALPIQARSGPIVVTIDYRIDEADIPAFLAVMADRRRIRRRDGARHWSLLRDLEQPDLWVERYQSPTWIDYVRHNQRITHADESITLRLRALNRNEHPVVRRLIERQPEALAHPLPAGPAEMAEPLTDPVQQS